uniref:Si:ch211-214j8.1 n=1 Tax=Sinocyclocheilus grahami TaxID=75366 RepID=A0A672RMP2_SINGR
MQLIVNITKTGNYNFYMKNTINIRKTHIIKVIFMSESNCDIVQYIVTRLFYMQGKLVYANQGKMSDYELFNRALDLRGTIAITRYGGEGRSKKVRKHYETYPYSWYLPPPDDTYRIPKEDKTGIPPIPAQPIGFEDAERLICNVHLDIYNTERLKYSANVMGVIRGSLHLQTVFVLYVVYGNHRDSWVHGAIAPSSGTAVMLEITRVLGKMVKEGKWQPRRSIIFGSWGAEEFEMFVLRSTSNIIFLQFSTWLLLLQQHIYENWIQFSNRTSLNYGIYTKVCSVGFLTGAGSDNAAFMHYLGITSMDISYYYDWVCEHIYPAYYTAYDTFDYTTFHYAGFTSHQAVARTAGNVLLRLADSLLLPFNCSDYAESPEQYLSQAWLESSKCSRNITNNITFIFKFTSASLWISQPLKVRQINDQLMLLDRAFLDPLAFPEQYGFRHVIWSSSVPTFPGLADAVEKAESTGLKEDWDQAHKHISIITQAIAGAAHTLDDVI